MYRWGHRAPSTKAQYLAAVLAFGEGAVLCGRAAAYLFRLVKGRPPGPEVLAPRNRQVSGVALRRAREMDPRDTTTLNNIPITTVPRTLVDLAGQLSLDELAYAAHQAEVLHRTRPAHVAAAIERHPNAKGVGSLRALFHGGTPMTLSHLERAFLDVLKEEGLPLPQTNRHIDGHYVDCRWPEHRLTVELDGFAYHHTRHAWEQDRRRARVARARGDEFRRYTYGDVVEDRHLMIAELKCTIPPN